MSIFSSLENEDAAGNLFLRSTLFSCSWCFAASDHQIPGIKTSCGCEVAEVVAEVVVDKEGCVFPHLLGINTWLSRVVCIITKAEWSNMLARRKISSSLALLFSKNARDRYIWGTGSCTAGVSPVAQRGPVPTAAQKYLVPTNRGDYPSCALPRSGHAYLETRMDFDPMISNPSNLVTKCPFSAWWKLLCGRIPVGNGSELSAERISINTLDELLALLGPVTSIFQGISSLL
jgi:hypothetical protein